MLPSSPTSEYVLENDTSRADTEVQPEIVSETTITADSI